MIVPALYYLFEMGWIVDRIVNLHAPAAKLAQEASIEILEARRAKRNYLLLHDPIYRAANRESLARSREILSRSSSSSTSFSNHVGLIDASCRSSSRAA